MDREVKTKIKLSGCDGVKNTLRGAKRLIADVKEDVAAVRERDPAARSDAEVLLL